MEELLKNLQLSDKAIEIYLRCLGQQPLSSFELFSLLPDVSPEEFSNIVNELVEAGLFIPIKPKGSKLILQYLALPPIHPILNYYSNINTNLEIIKERVQKLISNSLTSIFQNNKIIELDTIYKATQELRKDIEEDVIIQKQDIDEIVQGIEILRVTKKILDDLRQSIKSVTQTQFSYLINLITNIKTDISKKVESLELKKNEKIVKDAVEDVFQENLNKFLGDFTANLHKLLDEEFENTIGAHNKIINSTFQLRNDFQMVLLNMLNSYESKINTIIELIKKKRTRLGEDLRNFENVILENFKEIIYNSIDSVAALNNPINTALESYLSKITPLENNDFWDVKSVSRVNEEIINKISQSKQNLLIILPKLEDHLALDDFKTVSNNLRIEIASSEPHTNSHVKNIKELKNLEFRTLKNDNIIICRSDDDFFLIGMLKLGSQNPLDDFLGFATRSKVLIKLFFYVVNAVWETASSSLHETPKSLGISAPIDTERKKATIPTTSNRFTTQQIKTANKPIEQPGSKITQNSINIKKSEKTSSLTENIRKKIEEPIKPLDIKPTPKKTIETIKLDEDAKFLIKKAFKDLIQKLHKLNGEEFSKEMEIIADLILEKKGFSVTLHKIRSKINQYKLHLGHLNDTDISHIIESIEEWENHIL